MSGRADVGRTAVYAAEEAAFGGTSLDDERTLAELVAVAAELTSGDWWTSADGPAVTVVPARAGARSSCARATGHPDAPVVVTMATGQLTLATLAHELAHALAGVARGHDATFRAAHEDVVALLGGASAARAITAAYAGLGVPPGARQWPAPVRMVGDGFAVLP